jgi:hypothetical protein
MSQLVAVEQVRCAILCYNIPVGLLTRIGNIGKEPPASGDDLTTPTIKSDTYTTGRGGSGNMAKNDPNHPELARASQDVEPVPKTERSGSFHIGRGGAANVAKSDDGTKGGSLLDKGKELLEKVGGKK